MPNDMIYYEVGVRMTKLDEANMMYKTLCETFGRLEWTYNKEERDGCFIVCTSVAGKNVPINLTIWVDVNRQLMYLKSPMPFHVPQEKRNMFAQALIRANWTMLNGSFEMDFSDGFVAFKLVLPYMFSLLSVEACRYMILLSCDVVDKFTDKFQALVDDRMTMEEFKTFLTSY